MIKRAFTLAEVLITMAILGVIAALVTPTLMADVNKNTWTNSLKTNVSILNSGFQQMMALEDVNDMRDTILWSDYVKEDVYSVDNENAENIKKELCKYFKIDRMAKSEDMTYLNGSNNTAERIRFYLANSSAMEIYFVKTDSFSKCSAEQTFCHPIASILIDTNGDKKPNIIGRDIFAFLLGEDGVLYPIGSEAVHNAKRIFALWDNPEVCQGKNPKGDGTSCTARVIEEGYKMNY